MAARRPGTRSDKRTGGKDARGLPRSGPLPRPTSRAEALAVLKAEAFAAPDAQNVRLEALEFTSVCPKTGQPDFAQVLIEYTPARRCLESRALKYYLWSFREEPAFCETLAAEIADDVRWAIAPKSLMVQIRQNVRGGILVTATAVR